MYPVSAFGVGSFDGLSKSVIIPSSPIEVLGVHKSVFGDTDYFLSVSLEQVEPLITNKYFDYLV